MSVQAEGGATSEPDTWFQQELERRLSQLEDPDYQATAEHLQPIPPSHWWVMFALAVPIALVIALVSYFTW